MNNKKDKDYGDMPEIPCSDYYDKKSEKAYKGCFWSMALALVIFLASVLMMSSCTTTKVVEVENVRTDTTYITKWHRDSVWLHDSIHVREKGDTVLIERWHTQWRDRLLMDTIYIATHDTIPRPYEVVKEVAAELSWWQRLRLWMGDLMLLSLLAVVGYFIWRIWNVRQIF